MHTLSDKVRIVQRKLKPAEAFTTKKWMVLAENLLAQAHTFPCFAGLADGDGDCGEEDRGQHMPGAHSSPGCR